MLCGVQIVAACSPSPGVSLGAHVGAGGDHERVVRDAASVGKLDLVRVRIDAGHAPLHEVHVTTLERLREVNDKVIGVGSERHVDRVGSERESVALRHECETGAIAQPHTKQERGLEAREAGAKDGDAGCSFIS
jgi:hypothetical protein